ncbi:MAG: hypothetical protein AB7N73_14980 [Gemmatimonadales bacterium]
MRYAALGQYDEELEELDELEDTELGGGAAPTVSLALEYEPRTEPPAVKVAAIPAWVVLVGVLGFGIWKWGQRRGA